MNKFKAHVNNDIDWESVDRRFQFCTERNLIAEIDNTAQVMQDALQQFADARDRNTAAQKQLIALRAGRAV